MARLPVHTAQSAPEPTRAALAAAERGAGYLSNLLGVLANAPVALEAYQTLSQINARAGLTLQEREVVQLVAGTRHGCTFCVAGHTALARNKPSCRPKWWTRCAPRAPCRTSACKPWPPSPKP